jgi:hypothetical protein
VDDRPNVCPTPVAGRVMAAALVVIALALAAPAASAVYDTWLAAAPAPPKVELACPVAVEGDLGVLKVVADRLPEYRCRQTRAGDVAGEFLTVCNEGAAMVKSRRDDPAEGAGTP